MLLPLPRYPSSTMPLDTLTITQSHTLLITCTCCYDESKGTKDQDFSYSFSDSLYHSSTMPLYTLTITHSHTLPIACTCCYDEIKGIQDQDFSCSFSDSLSHSSVCLSVCSCVGLTVLCRRLRCSPKKQTLSLRRHLPWSGQ